MGEQALGGQVLGVRRWTGIATVALVPRPFHSSAVFARESSRQDYAEGVPNSSIMDRRVVVEWGAERSRL